MIVFSAFTPHTPLLLPTVGQSAYEKMSGTISAMGEIQDALRDARPDTILIISAHATQHATAFSANMHDPYEVDLSAFGDLTTKQTFLPNLSLLDTIQRSMRKLGIPFTFDSAPTLDYGCAVPLIFLTESTPQTKIVPISWSGLSPKDHFDFGKALQDVCQNRPERIAVIASGDLAHSLSSDAPAGFHPEGKQFDEEVCRAVKQGTASTLLTIDESTRIQATECGYFPLLILFGLLDGIHTTPKLLSYESPFGVGYLVAEFQL